MSDTIYVVSFTEGSFEDVHRFETKDFAEGFVIGFSAGAHCYGAGSAFALVVDQFLDEELVEYDVDADEIARMREALKKETNK